MVVVFTLLFPHSFRLLLLLGKAAWQILVVVQARHGHIYTLSVTSTIDHLYEPAVLGSQAHDVSIRLGRVRAIWQACEGIPWHRLARHIYTTTSLPSATCFLSNSCSIVQTPRALHTSHLHAPRSPTKADSNDTTRPDSNDTETENKTEWTDAAQLAVEDDDDNDNDAEGPAPRMIDTDATDAMVEAWDCDVPAWLCINLTITEYTWKRLKDAYTEVSCDAQLLRTGDARKVFWEGTCLAFALGLVRAAGPPEEEGERACIAAWARFVGEAWHVPGFSAADLAVEGKEPREPQLHVLLRSFVFVGGGAEERPAAVLAWHMGEGKDRPAALGGLYDGDASYVYSEHTRHEYDWTGHPDDPKEWLREDWPEEEKDEEEKEGSAKITTTVTGEASRMHALKWWIPFLPSFLPSPADHL
ncbi:hypothetical protein DFH27DRAFT_529388 [Peziza echinospora]|nr:hypothetical protein DFH27DRAFT_529388 [Peziza echinospora]